MAALPLQSYIAQSSSFQRTYRRREMRLGDGFSQRVQDGLNAAGWKGTINFENLNATDFGTLITFLDSVGSWGTFDYTPPVSATSYKWSVDPAGPSISTPGGNIFNVSIQARTEFDF
jgi:phage-related protein